MDRRPAFGAGRLVALLAVLASLAASAGCTAAFATAAYLIRGTDDPADYNGLKGKKVAVVCRPLVGLTYRDSGVAKDLGQHITLLLKQKVAKIEIIDQGKVDEWVDENTWDEYEEVGKALKADFIVGVDLEQFSIYEGQTVYQGKARVDLKVYDCATGDAVFERRLPPIVYPPNHVVSTGDVQESDFRGEFVAVLGERIARHFYPHDPHADMALDTAAIR